MVVVKVWASQFAHHLKHLLSNNARAVAIFQTGNGRELFLQACSREILLTCVILDKTLAVGHVDGFFVTATTADALSWWLLGKAFMDKVEVLLKENDITCISIPTELFHLFNDF